MHGVPDLSYHQLSGALGAAPAGIVICDPHQPGYPAVYANEEFSAITGYSTDEVVGRSLKLLQGPGTDPSAIETIRASLAACRPVTVELLNYRKDGTAFWMGVRIRPVFKPSGRLAAFVGVLSDMTERHLSEDSVRESVESLRAITEALPLPLLRIQLDGQILEANILAHQLFGVAPSGLVGRMIKEFGEPGDEGAKRLCHTLQERGSAQRIEVNVRRQDGSSVVLMASAQHYSVHGEVHYLLIFQDVSEMKHNEQQLTRANEEAERTIRARMSFLAAASHDLRQPLQALALFASALDNHVSTPPARKIVASIKQSLRGMEQMFDSLLDMSRLDAGVTRAEPQAFLINDIFERLETECVPQAVAAGLDLRFVPSSATVRSDPRLLSRIIGNFLANALRYTRRGRILVGCRHGRNFVRVIVCDTGPGIPESQRLAMFREFHQGDTAGRGAGMGLGLSIVQRFARLLGHRLAVHSVEGRGTSFSVEVPLAEEWQAPATREDDAPARDVSGATVVVVDDDLDIRSGLQILLAAWDCNSVVAATIDQAIGELANRGLRPDVVLADLHLPENENGGVAAIAAIRARFGAKVPAFVFTGDSAAQLELGDNLSVLLKPIDPARLRTVLAGALGR